MAVKTVCVCLGLIYGSVITVGLELGLGLGVGIWLGLGLVIGLALWLDRVVDCCIETAGESDKMGINHVITTDRWRSTMQICPAPHFVVSPQKSSRQQVLCCKHQHLRRFRYKYHSKVQHCQLDKLLLNNHANGHRHLVLRGTQLTGRNNAADTMAFN